MMDRLRELIPQEFLDNELAELREHKRRIALLLFSLFGLLTVVIFDGAEPVRESSVEEVPITSEPRVEKKSMPVKDRRTEIIGLAKASEDVKLINPFAVDLPKPPPEPIIIPIASPPPPPPTTLKPKPALEKKSIEKLESPPSAPRVMLTLKGTAISDDKKIAVVHREIVSTEDKSGNVESRLLKIGESLDGRKVVDIGKNFVEFEDGKRLELSRLQP